jgi:hypothetical protein
LRHRHATSREFEGNCLGTHWLLDAVTKKEGKESGLVARGRLNAPGALREIREIAIRTPYFNPPDRGASTAQKFNSPCDKPRFEVSDCRSVGSIDDQLEAGVVDLPFVGQAYLFTDPSR